MMSGRDFLQKFDSELHVWQTVIAEHQLIHFDAGLLKYEGLTQILLKFQTKLSI